MPTVSIPLITHSSIQEILDRNNKLLLHIKECQDNGWMDEAKIYQKRLKANLISLGMLADEALSKPKDADELQTRSCNMQVQYKDLQDSFSRMGIINSLRPPIMTKVPEFNDFQNPESYDPSSCLYDSKKIKLVEAPVARSILISRLGPVPMPVPVPDRDSYGPGGNDQKGQPSFLSPLAANVMNAPALALFSDLGVNTANVNANGGPISESDQSDEEYRQPEGTEEENSEEEEEEEEEEYFSSDNFAFTSQADVYQQFVKEPQSFISNHTSHVHELPTGLLSAFHDDGSAFAASHQHHLQPQNTILSANALQPQLSQPLLHTNANMSLNAAPFFATNNATFDMFQQPHPPQQYQQQQQLAFMNAPSNLLDGMFYPQQQQMQQQQQVPMQMQQQQAMQMQQQYNPQMDQMNGYIGMDVPVNFLLMHQIQNIPVFPDPQPQPQPQQMQEAVVEEMEPEDQGGEVDKGEDDVCLDEFLDFPADEDGSEEEEVIENEKESDHQFEWD